LESKTWRFAACVRPRCNEHCAAVTRYSRHVSAIPWPSGRWRARRRIDTGHAGRLHSHERARGQVQPRCRGRGGVGRGKGCRRRHRSGGGPPALRDAHGRGRHSAAPAHGGRGGRHGARAGGWDRLPRDGVPLAAPLDGDRNLRRAAVTEAGAQARSPTGHRGRVEHRKSLRAVSVCHSWRWGGAGGRAPSRPCDPCGRTVLLSHVTLFDFTVIATRPTLTRPQIPEDTNADCHLSNGEQVP